MSAKWQCSILWYFFCFSKQLLSMFPLPYLTALHRVVTDSQILQQCFVVSRTALITTIVAAADADTNSWDAVGTNRHKCRCTNNQIIFFLLAATRSRRLQPADSAVVGASALRRRHFITMIYRIVLSGGWSHEYR